MIRCGASVGLGAMDLPDGVGLTFAGEAEDQAGIDDLPSGAFVTAIALMFIILLIQFNNFYQALVVMSAIVFSIAGVLFGSSSRGAPSAS